MYKYVLLNVFLISSTIALCPEIKTVENFNLTEYVKQKWYIQKQQVTQYLPLEENYCVTASYNFSNKKIPFYQGLVLSVYNYANLNKTNGENTNVKNIFLCARIPNDTVKSKLLVAPCFLPNVFAGDYWVIAVGPNSNNYQWAIVSGGQPTVQYEDGCTTRNDTVNHSGFWFLTRNQTVNNTLLEIMLDVAKQKGFTTSQLNNVKQIGCKYL